MHPKLVIIGRPNVGKSSLFNRLAGRRVAIVDPRPGVTRDRLSTYVRLGESEGVERWVELIDTGGWGLEDEEGLTREIEKQIGLAVKEADLVLLVVDAQAGIVPLDREIARRLREGWQDRRSAEGLDKKVVVVANKVDSARYEAGAAEASVLGWGKAVSVSAKSGYGCRELVQVVQEAIAWEKYPGSDQEPERGLLLAIVGRRNVGKSTLVNALAGAERVIVSELAGTTRDAVDVRFELKGRVFTAIDTAGLRRIRGQGDDVVFYSQTRTLRALRRAEVVLFVIDATEPISQVDQKLEQEILKEGKPVVLVVNKWDLAEGKAKMEDYSRYLTEELRGLDFAPIVFTSAKYGQGLEEMVGVAFSVYQQAGHVVSQEELERVFQEILAKRAPSSGIGRPARLVQVVQTGVYPPTIRAWVNDPTMFEGNYQRYLEHELRKRLPYAEVPIRLEFRRGYKRRKVKGLEGLEGGAVQEKGE